MSRIKIASMLLGLAALVVLVAPAFSSRAPTASEKRGITHAFKTTHKAGLNTVETYAAWDVTAVTAEELAAVRSFLERRHDLKPRAREELARTLAERLRPKVAGVQDPITAEAFLARLAAAKLARR